MPALPVGKCADNGKRAGMNVAPFPCDSIQIRQRRRGHALDNNSDFVGVVAAGIDWARWRQLDSPPARNCCRRPDHQSHSRQTRTLMRT